MKPIPGISLSALLLFVAGVTISIGFSGSFKQFQTGISSATLLNPAASGQNPVYANKLDTSPNSSNAQRAQKAPYVERMWVSPVTVYKNETLELHLFTPNASFLGVIDPGGHFFYLVFPGETVVGGLTPYVESKDFINMQSLKINTSSLKADPYTYDVLTNQPVFTKSGTYTFILGENLHMHETDQLEKTTVRYIHAVRPNQVRVVKQ